MKIRTIDIRLSDYEFYKLQRSADNEKTTISQYIRERINAIEPIGGKDVQIAVSKLCRIYTMLAEQKIDEAGDIMEGLSDICRVLY